MKTCLLLLLALLPGWLPAQADSTVVDDKNMWQLFTYDAANIITGIGYSYSRPFHWDGGQWATLGGVLAGTGLLYAVDDNTSRFISLQRESIPPIIRDYGEFYGNPENNFLATTGVYATGLILRNEKLRRTGVLLISSASAAGLLQQIVKSAVGRARPVSGRSKDTFDPFSQSREFHSFPSGHAIMAFTNAYAIAKQFKSPWVKAGIYTLGALPGISRVWDRQHWVSDLALSIALSIATVESIDRYLDSRYDQKYNNGDKDVSWDLQAGPGVLGVSVTF